MPTLHIAFQEGFVNDTAVVRLDGKEVFRKTDLNTRLQIGLAHAFDLEVSGEPVEIELEIATRNVAKVIPVAPGDTPYLGVSLSRQGEITSRASHEPFGYV